MSRFNHHSVTALMAGLFCIVTVSTSQARQTPDLTGNCAQLPADRTTEFHGNPATSNLNLAMAGNQWVVWPTLMQAFNQLRADSGEDIDLTAIGNQTRTYDGLQKKGADYFIELIPPGQERNQIKSGCMLLGNEDDRNFLPTSIQVKFDVFTSTNFNLMRDLGTSGWVSEAIPYIRNQLTLMTDDTNSNMIGVGGTDAAIIIDATLDLLDPAIRVSEVDHINEGVHRGINAMYQRMDTATRASGTATEIALLDARLAAVATPQPGSPAATRTGITTNFDLKTNPACNYGDDPVNPTLRMCEFAILNKANTHETRVHHVETPERILSGDSDVGPVWVSELQFALNAGDLVAGSQMPDSVNLPVVYSVALLTVQNATHRHLAEEFVNFLLGDAQQIFVDGGFTALTGSEQGERYSLDNNGDLVIETFTP